MANPPGSTTAAVSVVFLSLVDFATQPVATQARLKERLEGLVTKVIAGLTRADRIVADQTDGVAVAVLSSPADALQLARRARRHAGRGRDALPLRIGVNHGALRLAPDAQGEVWLVGDVVAAGASIAGFAEPGSVVASRSFRDALQPDDPAGVELLRPAGTFTDSGLRSHELFAFDASARDLGATDLFPPPRRRLLLIAATSVVGILAAGFAARLARRAAARAKRPAMIELDIAPWGIVIVDGEPKGKTPPLQRLEVPPGRHAIEIRHPQQPPVVAQVDLGPAEAFTLRHSFAMPAPAASPAPPSSPKPAPKPVPAAKPAPQEKPSAVRRAWDEFRKSLQ